MKNYIRLMLDADGWTMLGGPIGGAIMGAFSDQRQDAMNRINTRRQVEASKELTDYNTRKQLQMWEATGYGPQMEQMRKAGVNPALLYGKGGAGGQTAAISPGSAGMGAAPSAGGEGLGMVNAVMEMALLSAKKDLLKADAENKNADTTNKPIQGANIAADTKLKEQQTQVAKVTEELNKIDLKVGQETLWERINGVIAGYTIQEETAIIAGVNKTVAENTVDDQVKAIKAEAINKGLQGEAIKAGIGLTEEQTRKVGQDIMQKWQELNLTAAKNEWEHHDRMLGIKEFTENALKVAGIQAVGNVVRDVLGVVTKKPIRQKTSETQTTYGPKGETSIERTFNYK